MFPALFFTAILSGLFVLMRGTRPDVNIEWSVASWRFGHYERVSKIPVELVKHGSIYPNGLTVVEDGIRLGPVCILATKVMPSASPVGTNELRIGSVLYSAFEHQKIGTVRRIEQEHNFPSGAVQTGILIRGETGTERWFPKQDLRGTIAESF